MKKVVFVIPTLGSGGAERVISTLSNEFIESGFNVTIVLTYDDIMKYELNSRIKVVSLNCKRFENLRAPRKLFTRWKIIRKELLGLAPNVVISFMSENNIDVCMALFGTKIPLIVSERNDPKIDPPSRFKQKMRKIAYLRPQRFVFQTPDAQSFFSKRIQDKSVIILNPLTSQLPERYVGEREKRIVTVCRLNEQKNLHMLIDAFCDFKNTFPEYTLEIFGEGHLEGELREHIKDKGLVDKVILRGYCSNVHEEIRSASLFVLSSNFEGMPNALIEAMALGLPCISTDCPCGGPNMLIEDGCNGILVPVGATAILSKAMKQIINDSIMLEQISSAATKLRFSVDKKSIVGQWLDEMDASMNCRHK